jgi:RimJ/RimL family protein N-acetyltransferase
LIHGFVVGSIIARRTRVTTETNDEPILMIRGDLVGLGPIRLDLAPTYQRWLNELRAIRTLGVLPRPMSFEAELSWVEQALISRDVIFTIYVLSPSDLIRNDQLQAIGNTNLFNIDHHNGTADFGILIGEPDAWGKGYGTEATRLMLDYAFDVLGLHNVQLQVYSNNDRAVRAYQRAGFHRVGVRRAARKLGRERHDVIYMDAVADDHPRSSLHGVMHPGQQPSG